MAIILRVDVDSPYGKKNFFNHFLSRLTSDLNIRPITKLSYLEDVKFLIHYLNANSYRGYFFPNYINKAVHSYYSELICKFHRVPL